MAKLIEDLLDMSRIISGNIRLELQPVDMSAMAQTVINSVTPAAEARNIRLKFVNFAARHHVSGDSLRLQQILSNLMSNAMKFTPDGGTITLRLAQKGPSVEVIVSDTGQGIKPEFLPHVFERFRQADSSTTRRHGVGLGLAIVKHLVELHGGKVTADSAGEGKGATFTVTLPTIDVLVAPAPLKDANGKPAADVSLRGIKVLVVDDERDARELVERILADAGASVTTAASAPQALSRVNVDRPNVVLSDISMPEEDGYQLIRKLRAMPEQHGGKTPAMALTAFARPEDRAKALEAGFQRHLSKPVDAAELIAAVADLASSKA
jgi:CheY-like chemotaxis protein/two-component sensor histidine kinase